MMCMLLLNNNLVYDHVSFFTIRMIRKQGSEETLGGEFQKYGDFNNPFALPGSSIDRS